MSTAVSLAPGGEARRQPFFDLVYVFAIGRLSHHLLEHVDLRRARVMVMVIMALAVV
jgi:low temperature requirement protein LtrA